MHENFTTSQGYDQHFSLFQKMFRSGYGNSEKLPALDFRDLIPINVQFFGKYFFYVRAEHEFLLGTEQHELARPH